MTAFSVYAAPKPGEPTADAFWQRAPVRDATTLLLWQLDNDQLGQPEDTAVDFTHADRLDSELANIGKTALLGGKLHGDAVIDKAGRFGGALRAAGKGWAESGHFGSTEQVTLDFWIKPEGPAGTVLHFGKKPILERDAAGNLKLGATVHPRKAPTGEWTHIALVTGPRSQFLVNGTPASATMPGIDTVCIGQGFTGWIDAVRLSRGERRFYELEDRAQFGTQPLEKSQPYFIFNRPLNVETTFDDQTTPGVRGHAFDLSKGAFSIPGTNLFPITRGSVEFWVQPLDWDNSFNAKLSPSEIPWVPLLQYGPQGAPYHQSVRNFSLAKGKFTLDEGARRAAIPLRPGKWTHVLCAWDEKTTAVYLDGRPQPVAQGSYSSFVVPKDGAEYVLSLPQSNTLVDELRIYSWPLTAAEARNAYSRFFTDAKLTPMPYISVSPSFSFYESYLKIGISCIPVDNIEPASVDVCVAGVTNNLLLNATFQAGFGMPGKFDFGRYPITVTSKAADGRVLKTLETAYERVRPAWWQNDLGKGFVPAPWTPVKVEENTAKVWGGTLKVAPGGLPEWETFAGPPRLYATAGGKPVPFVGSNTLLAPDGSWTNFFAFYGLGRIATSGSIEYDGLIKCSVTLDQPAQLDSLTLEFPLKATQIIVNGGGHNFRASWHVENFGDKPGHIWNSRTYRPQHKAVAFGNFCPIVWLGDDERGVCFFGENDKGWTPNAKTAAQEVVREGDTVIYRMNVISQPVTNPAPRTFTFYMQATPTKPLPEGWRTYNRGGFNGTNACYDAIDAFVSPTLTIVSNAGYHAGITFQLEPHDWESARINANQIRDRFGKANPVFLYIDASWPQLGPSMNEYKHGLFWTGRLTWSREVEDYMVWIINEYIQRGIIDGIYIDDTSCSSTRAMYATAYEMPDGQPQPGFNTLGFRRFLQRVWVLFTKAGKQPNIVPHMTYCFEVPALSFASAVVNGEDRDIYEGAQHTFMDVWGRDELRVMGSSPKWGFINFWKPTVVTKPSLNPTNAQRTWLHRQSRAMHALVVPHDLWYTWLYPTSRTIEGPLIQFGLADARFIPYWDLAGHATVTGSNILCSIYAKPGKALVMVSNPLKQDQEVTVTVDPQKLFGKAGPVTWKDVDSSLMPPKSNVDKTQVKLEEENVLNLLDGSSPEEKEASRLALRPEGHQLRLIVRKQDFRLVEVTGP